MRHLAALANPVVLRRSPPLIFALALVQVTPLHAQTARAVADVTDEIAIVVTAPGRAPSDETDAGVTAAQMTRGGAADMLGGLARHVPGVSLSDAQGNPYQPNLVYRGFVASPLQGNSQGLAFYVDGARFNQPFGDTVEFDLLPQAAISRVRLHDADPVYGLNALGGSVIVETRNGRTAPGLLFTAGGGDHRRIETTAEAGWAKDAWSGYISLEARNDRGWRRYSPSTLYNGFADVGWDGDHAGIHAKLTGADTDLTGNGSAPVELLAVDRRAVFTWPDHTANRFYRLGLHPWVGLTDETRLEASLYAQHLGKRTINGDAADIEACDDDDAPGLLCLESVDDKETLLTDTAGRAIPDTLGGEGYGLLNRTHTVSDSAGILVQIEDKRPAFAGDNVLVVGISHDRSRTRFAASSELGALTDSRSVEGLGPIVAQSDGAILPVKLISRTRYTGVFLSDRLPLARGIAAEVALRWNAARVSLDDRLGTALNGTHLFHRLNPGATLEFAPARGMKLRLGYAQSNRAPTPAELSCASPDAPCSLTNFFVADPPLEQVVAKSWNAQFMGARAGLWTFEWTLDAYRSTSRNDIQLIASDVRGRGYFQNVGDTRRQGLEASLGATRGPWTLRAGYALSDARFRSPLTIGSPDNPSAEADGTISVEPGDRIPGVPRHRAVASVDYSGLGFRLGADLQAQSGQVLFGDESNQQPRTRGFAVFGVHASARISGPLWLFGEVTNLFDAERETFGAFSETGEIDLREAPGASNPRSLGPGAPRRWLLGIRAAIGKRADTD